MYISGPVDYTDSYSCMQSVSFSFVCVSAQQSEEMSVSGEEVDEYTQETKSLASGNAQQDTKPAVQCRFWVNTANTFWLKLEFLLELECLLLYFTHMAHTEQHRKERSSDPVLPIHSLIRWPTCKSDGLLVPVNNHSCHGILSRCRPHLATAAAGNQLRKNILIIPGSVVCVSGCIIEQQR